MLYFDQVMPSAPKSESKIIPDLLQSAKTKRLQVIEVGAGCGTVGIAFAQLVKCDMYLTDLDDAQGMLSLNVQCATLMAGSTLEFGVLNWASGPDGGLRKTYDLVLVSDCIYNPESSGYLVDTLSQLAQINPNIVVLVGYKRRHEADSIFFERMQGAQFNVLEATSIPLPHITTAYDDEAPATDLFVYQHASRQETK
jgi:predicted nicotinamide N-methyase